MHYAAKAAAFSRLYPGAVSALGALREAGVPLGLCTNKPEAIARDLLQALGVAGNPVASAGFCVYWTTRLRGVMTAGAPE